MEPGTLITAENVGEVRVGDIIAFVRESRGTVNFYTPSDELTVISNDGSEGFQIRAPGTEYDAWFLVDGANSPNFRFLRRGDQAAPPVAGWLTIDTAPHACHVLACRLLDEGEWLMRVVMSPPSKPFTHWMPLPAPPKVEG